MLYQKKLRSILNPQVLLHMQHSMYAYTCIYFFLEKYSITKKCDIRSITSTGTQTYCFYIYIYIYKCFLLKVAQLYQWHGSYTKLYEISTNKVGAKRSDLESRQMWIFEPAPYMNMLSVRNKTAPLAQTVLHSSKQKIAMSGPQKGFTEPKQCQNICQKMRGKCQYICQKMLARCTICQKLLEPNQNICQKILERPQNVCQTTLEQY